MKYEKDGRNTSLMEVLNRPDPETVAEVVDDSDINEEIEEEGDQVRNQELMRSRI